MENKHVGYILLVVSILIIGIVFLYSSALKDIVKTSCKGEHADSCPMYQSINNQTYIAFGIITLLIIISIFLIFSKPVIQEKIIIKKILEKRQKKKINTSGFRPEDVEVLKLVQEHKTMFQADLIEKTSFSKTKMTRIIDRLEGKNLVERKRRGMTNVIVMNEDYI